MRWIVFVLLIAVSSTAEAGPFRRRTVVRSSATCGDCTSRLAVRYGTGAQGHAEAMASAGRQWHARPAGVEFEGTGEGSSPEAALANCCPSSLPVIEEGYAYGNGRWFACRRHGR